MRLYRAWQRPDQFRKVISTIGSFTNILGDHVYPDLIRKTDAKPIRVYLQDGMNDTRGIGKRKEGPYDRKWDWHAQDINGRGADGKKVRREFLLGHRNPQRQAWRRHHAEMLR